MLTSNLRAPFVLAAAAFLAACAGQAPPYASCGGNVGCESGSCYDVRFTRSDGTDAAGRFCSRPCASDAECPAAGACIALAGMPSPVFFCAARCAMAADCYAPLACTHVGSASGAFDVCLP